MADKGNARRRDDEPSDEAAAHSGRSRKPRAEGRVELRDSLPGDRAVIAVEQEGCFTWVASRKHMDQQAVDEFTEQLDLLLGEGWWVQNWPGAN